MSTTVRLYLRGGTAQPCRCPRRYDKYLIAFSLIEQKFFVFFVQIYTFLPTNAYFYKNYKKNLVASKKVVPLHRICETQIAYRKLRNT